MKKILLLLTAITIFACTKKSETTPSSSSSNTNTTTTQQDAAILGNWCCDSSKYGINATIIFTGLPLTAGYSSDSLFITSKLNEYTYAFGKNAFRQNIAWKTFGDSLITYDSFGNTNIKYYYSMSNKKLITCYNSNGNKSYFWYHKN